MSQQQQLPDSRRQARSDSERRRRNCIKSAYDDLDSALDDIGFTSSAESSSSQSHSRAAILESTAAAIESLRRTRDERERRVNDLRRRVEATEAICRGYRLRLNQLTSSGAGYGSTSASSSHRQLAVFRRVADTLEASFAQEVLCSSSLNATEQFVVRLDVWLQNRLQAEALAALGDAALQLGGRLDGGINSTANMDCGSRASFS